MGKRGPPKTPTNVLAFRGSWRAKVRKTEPKPKGKLPPCPAWLLPLAKEAWKRLAKQLPWLRAPDADALAIYCQCFARWRAAEDWMTKSGTVAVYKHSSQAAPEFTIAMKCLEKMNRIAAQLGMTPAARAGLLVDPEQESDDFPGVVIRDRSKPPPPDDEDDAESEAA